MHQLKPLLPQSTPGHVLVLCRGGRGVSGVGAQLHPQGLMRSLLVALDSCCLNSCCGVLECTVSLRP